jgi:hypothetical protein
LPSEDPNDWWPCSYGYELPNLKTVKPERLPPIAEALLKRGYSDKDVAAGIGTNGS